MTDIEALNKIQDILWPPDVDDPDSYSWSPDTIEGVAEVMGEAGRHGHRDHWNDAPVDIEFLLEAARRHAFLSEEPGHEVGDLQALARTMWNLLSSAKRDNVMRSPVACDIMDVTDEKLRERYDAAFLKEDEE